MVYFNNRYIPATTFAVNSGNRAFKYGDALFETLLIINKKTPLLNYNLQRLKKGMLLLGINFPDAWNIVFFEDIIASLTNELNLENGRCKITVWRDGGGLYKPEINDAALLIEITPITSPVLSFVQKDLRLGVYDDYPKMIHPLSACKTANALPYVLAAKFAAENQFDDVLLLNTDDLIADAISSNIVIVKNNSFYTTTTMNGGVEDAHATIYLRSCRRSGYRNKQDAYDRRGGFKCRCRVAYQCHSGYCAGNPLSGCYV